MLAWFLCLMRNWMEMPYEDCGQPAGTPSFSTSAKMAPAQCVSAFLQHSHASVPDTWAPRLPATPREDTALLALSFSSMPFGKSHVPKFQAVPLPRGLNQIMTFAFSKIDSYLLSSWVWSFLFVCRIAQMWGDCWLDLNPWAFGRGRRQECGVERMWKVNHLLD